MSLTTTVLWASVDLAANAMSGSNPCPGPQLTMIGCLADTISTASVLAWAPMDAGPDGGGAMSMTADVFPARMRQNPIVVQAGMSAWPLYSEISRSAKPPETPPP